MVIKLSERKILPMKNYKQILFLGILAISINCFGNSYFQIERIEKGSYAIPLVSNIEHPEIAEKINQFIQMTTGKSIINIGSVWIYTSTKITA